MLNRDEEDDLLDGRDLSDDENAMQMPPMDGSEAFHQVVKEMLLNGHQVGALCQRSIEILDMKRTHVSLPCFWNEEKSGTHRVPGWSYSSVL